MAKTIPVENCRKYKSIGYGLHLFKLLTHKNVKIHYCKQFTLYRRTIWTIRPTAMKVIKRMTYGRIKCPHLHFEMGIKFSGIWILVSKQRIFKLLNNDIWFGQNHTWNRRVKRWIDGLAFGYIWRLHGNQDHFLSFVNRSALLGDMTRYLRKHEHCSHVNCWLKR